MEINIREWLKTLEVKSIDYMDSGYSIGTAMIKAWETSYGHISEDSDRWSFYICDLRDSFFDKSIDRLEEYEDKLIEKEY